MAAEKEKSAEKSAPVAPTAPPKPVTVEESLKNNVLLIQKSVKTKDTKQFMGRLLRQTAAIRRKLTPNVLVTFLSTLNTDNQESILYLQEVVKQYEHETVEPGQDVAMEAVPEPEEAAASSSEPEKMEVTEAAPSDDSSAAAAAAAEPAEAAEPVAALLEVELYAYLLVMTLLCDAKHFAQLKEVATRAAEVVQKSNRRTLDVLAARVCFYLSLAHERTDTLEQIRSSLLSLHRSAVLRHDALGQETLLCLLLRNYLHFGLYDQAEKFRSKAQRSETFVSSQQHCRYLYYLGRIHAVRLEYSEAKDCLTQAVRRAPSVANGFLTSATKWLSLVQLLLGEVPERQDFFQPLPAKQQPQQPVAAPSTTKAKAGGSGKTGTGATSGVAAAVRAVRPLAPSLKPYFLLTMAVKEGDMNAFAEVTSRHAAVFAADRTQALVARLRQSVLRAGIRRICAAYSRISLADVAQILQLPAAEDAEYIMAKAIATGAVDARLDHDAGEVRSRDRKDVYGGAEPQEAFHARTAFCLDLHNEAVKAMRYEPDAHKKALQSLAARKVYVDEGELMMLDEDDDDF